jgi:hypothetical protein
MYISAAEIPGVLPYLFKALYPCVPTVMLLPKSPFIRKEKLVLRVCDGKTRYEAEEPVFEIDSTNCVFEPPSNITIAGRVPAGLVVAEVHP